jgi:hypothetical protein
MICKLVTQAARRALLGGFSMTEEIFQRIDKLITDEETWHESYR